MTTQKAKSKKQNVKTTKDTKSKANSSSEQQMQANHRLNDIKKLIDKKVAKGYLSEEEVSEIVEGTRLEYKNVPLTDKEVDEIEKYATSALNEASLKKRPLTKKDLVMTIINFAMAFLQLPALISAFVLLNKYGSLQFSDYVTSCSSTLWLILVIFICITPIFDFFVLFFAIKHKPAWSARVLYGSIAKTVIVMICGICIYGSGWQFILLLVYGLWQGTLSSYLHPTLRTERLLANELLMLSTEKKAKSGTLGLQDDPKNGYIKLDFLNLFWIFVITSIIGLLVEDIFHMACVWEPGEFHDRAGLLFGPFSPIYGFGGLLMTIALNRIRNWPIIPIFIFCTIIGGGFEYFVSWFMETAFGIIAWDYTGHFLSIDGRTCLLFASMFGVLGTVWIKWLLPIFMKLINLIPWKWRYVVTGICAFLMAVNCVMTLAALDCWSSRLAGKEPATPIEEFFATNYDNDWMANRFESMNVDPSRAANANS